jgi:LPXTG-site transpeptidase (sortase) family protein
MVMSRLLERVDRRTLLGALVFVASAGLLAAGLLSVLFAITDDPADLPNEGSLESILSDSIDPDDPSALPDNADLPPRIPPVRISIQRLHIEAPVIALGTDENRLPRVPQSAEEVAWYDFSSTPGAGNTVLSGHVDWQTQSGQPIPGVFYRLRELQVDDAIEVELEDGSTATYRVTGNVATAFDDPNVLKAIGPTSKDVVTLVTCGGTWFNDPSRAYGGSYSHRILVRAERAPELAGEADRASG